ncbi:MAG: hypothetical protein ACK4LQ_07530 [Pararhodobacter sp.]
MLPKSLSGQAVSADALTRADGAGGQPPPLGAPAHRLRRRRFFIDAQHGLCNRLRAMASAAAIAARTDRELVVIWRTDHHCEARLGDLLDYSGPVIEDSGADAIRAVAGLEYNYMEIEPGSCFQAPILPGELAVSAGDVYVRSAYTLNSPHRTHEDEQRFLRALVPAEPVLDLVASVRHPNQVAVHIRMATGPGFDHLSHEAPENWPEERHRELAEWRARSHPRFFLARLDALAAQGQAQTIFLAADHPQTYAEFSERFGERLAWLPRRLFDRSAMQLQYALADLLLLTGAERFLGSSWSSFSDVAQRLAHPDRPFEQSGVDF